MHPTMVRGTNKLAKGKRLDDVTNTTLSMLNEPTACHWATLEKGPRGGFDHNLILFQNENAAMMMSTARKNTALTILSDVRLNNTQLYIGFKPNVPLMNED